MKRNVDCEVEKGKGLNRRFGPFITVPVGTERYLLVADHEIIFSRSMIEKCDNPRQDLMLDRLSECEKKKLFNLVKIQNDGTVEVDLEKDAPIASELLKFQSFEESRMSGTLISESKKSAPWLQIVILVVGTRGDVQPFLAIAKKLQEYGHRVRLATHADFDTFVKSAGVDFYPLGGDPRALAGYMVRNKGIIPSGPTEISIQRKQLKAIIDSILPACIAPDFETGVPFRAQAIISNPTACGHTHVAEALGVPLHIFFTMPWTPTYEFSHPLARVPQSAGYWLSYIIVDLLIWWGIRGIINDFRKRKLKLAPIAYFSMYSGSISHLPTGYMWSPHVVQKPSDWGPLVDVVGYCFLNLGSEYQPQEDFVRWIQKGPKPLYFGFGSMPLDDPKRTTDVIMEALKDTGQRGIIDRGWGNLGNLARVPDNVFVLEECPHDWLFPQCSALVHHGGAGTTATGLKAGCPTTIVPFFGDQFFWGDRIYQKGLGPAPIPISQLSLENLSNAIKFMLQPEFDRQTFSVAYHFLKAKTPEQRAVVDLDTHYSQEYLEEYVGTDKRRAILCQQYVKGISTSGMQSNYGFDGQLNACWRHKMTEAEIEVIKSAGFLVSVIHGRHDIITQIYYAKRLVGRLYPVARMVDLPGGHLVSHERSEEKKSATAKANRAIDKGASAYYGGSISTISHYEKLTIEHGLPPTAWKVMEKTKKLKSREWVNDKYNNLAKRCLEQ